MVPTVRERRAVGSLRALAFATAVATCVSGCPPEPQDPPRPETRSCATIADCNAGATCGLLAACVDQRCESARSLEVPCPESP
jgi:hypothetical protein